MRQLATDREDAGSGRVSVGADTTLQVAVVLARMEEVNPPHLRREAARVAGGVVARVLEEMHPPGD